jgi:hypothetical protein
MEILVSPVPANQEHSIIVSASKVDETVVLTVDGVLDGSTYLPLRDTIIKSALDEPRAVIIDVTELAVPTPSAWAVFTSARWHVGRWPDVPVMLVCAHQAGRWAITRNGVARYVPVYPTIGSTLHALSEVGRRFRRRARAELPAADCSVKRSRDLVADYLTDWSRAELIPAAKMVVSVLVENVLAHTDSSPTVRLESDGKTVTVAVSDTCTVPAARREKSAAGGDSVSGLAILAAMCRVWGNAPTPSGKTVWAVIGPENEL